MATRRVLKYSINERVPAQHKFLHVAQQDGDIRVWLEVEDGQQNVLASNPYHIMPTGFAEVPEGASHRMTFFSTNGNVWHVYDLGGDV